jgi:hypothetical protein
MDEKSGFGVVLEACNRTLEMEETIEIGKVLVDGIKINSFK